MSPILTWEGTGEVPDFCPQGCGGITEDPYGGPCKACWAAVDAGPDTDDDGDGEHGMEEMIAYLVADMGYSRNECPDHCPYKADEHAHLHSPGNPASIGTPPVDFIYWGDGTSSHSDPTRPAPYSP